MCMIVYKTTCDGPFIPTFQLDLNLEFDYDGIMAHHKA